MLKVGKASHTIGKLIGEIKLKQVTIMKSIQLDHNAIKEIINKTIGEIDNSRGEIVNIVDYVRTEHDSIISELQEIRKKAEQIIELVDTLEMKDKLMRKRLALVSKEFDKFKESEVKVVYDQALEIRTQYMLNKNEEKQLITRRNQLEISLKKSAGTIESAEKAINRISLAASYLKGEILSTFEGIDQTSEMFFGIKILEAQENERKRISRDIHDGPAQYIANILMKADICERIIQADMKKGLGELHELKFAVSQALKEVRGIIYDLRPMSLDDLGLGKTIEEFIKKSNEDGALIIHLKLKPISDQIESIIQVAVFRIIQEIVNNIKKHARAKQIEISLDYGAKYLRVILIDDGIGFDVEETMKKVRTGGSSYGLVGILERVKQLQGQIIIDSSAGKGTAYNIKLPVNREVMQDETSSD